MHEKVKGEYVKDKRLFKHSNTFANTDRRPSKWVPDVRWLQHFYLLHSSLLPKLCNWYAVSLRVIFCSGRILRATKYMPLNYNCQPRHTWSYSCITHFNKSFFYKIFHEDKNITLIKSLSGFVTMCKECWTFYSYTCWHGNADRQMPNFFF